MAQVIPLNLFAQFVKPSQGIQLNFDAVEIGIVAIVVWKIYNIQILTLVRNQLPN